MLGHREVSLLRVITLLTLTIMNTKPLTLLTVGTLGLAVGFGSCWYLPGGFRARANSNQTLVANGDRGPGVIKVIKGLLNASAEALEDGKSVEGKALLLAAMAHPAASHQDIEAAVEFAISRAAAPKTSLQMKCDLLQGVGAKLMECVASAKDQQELSGLFEMRDKLVNLHQGVAGNADSALLAQIRKLLDKPASNSMHNLAASEEWHDFMVAKRCAPLGWVQSDEIIKDVTELIKRAALSIPERKELEGLMPADDSDLNPEADKLGVLEVKKAQLAKMLRENSGADVVAIPKVLGEQSLSEKYEDLAANLVAAIRSSETIQLRAYNLWALSRIHASEMAPGWNSLLAPIDTSYLQNVVATMYGDVSRRRLDAESQPAMRASKVREMIRQVKIKPTNF